VEEESDDEGVFDGASAWEAEKPTQTLTQSSLPRVEYINTNLNIINNINNNNNSSKKTNGTDRMEDSNNLPSARGDLSNVKIFDSHMTPPNTVVKKNIEELPPSDLVKPEPLEEVEIPPEEEEQVKPEEEKLETEEDRMKRREREKEREFESLIYPTVIEGEFDSRPVLHEMQQSCLEMLQVVYYQLFTKSASFEKVLRAHRKLKQVLPFQAPSSSSILHSLEEVNDDLFDESKFKLVIKEKISSRKLQKQKNKKVRYKIKALPFPLGDKKNLTIGRDLTNYISIGDSGISRTHARLEWDTHKLIYVDTGSSFGSKLNGETLHRSPIKVGDHIQIGRSVITVRRNDWIGDEEGREDCVGSSRLDLIDRMPLPENSSTCTIS